MARKNVIDEKAAKQVQEMLFSVMDTERNMHRLMKTVGAEYQDAFVRRLAEINSDTDGRSVLLGNALFRTHRMISNAETTEKQLSAYSRRYSV